MRTPKIYIETSIFNFVFADDAPDKRDDALVLFQGETVRRTLWDVDYADAEKVVLVMDNLNTKKTMYSSAISV